MIERLRERYREFEHLSNETLDFVFEEAENELQNTNLLGDKRQQALLLLAAHKASLSLTQADPMALKNSADTGTPYLREFERFMRTACYPGPLVI